jgi:hypothetical protein
MTDQLESKPGINLNTILIALVLGVMSWVGYTTQQTSVAVAVAAEKSSIHDRELLDLRARVAQVELQVATLKSLR